VCLIEADRRLVVGTHLEEHRRARRVRPVEQRAEQRPAHTSPLPLRGDRDRVHVRLHLPTTDQRHARVTNEPWTVHIGSQVVVTSGQFRPEGGLTPRIVPAEKHPLQLRTAGKILTPQRF
jgi:hypothetical protein